VGPVTENLLRLKGQSLGEFGQEGLGSIQETFQQAEPRASLCL
jgi:hypothetical protein